MAIGIQKIGMMVNLCMAYKLCSCSFDDLDLEWLDARSQWLGSGNLRKHSALDYLDN